jgi:hypothetical protein
MEALGSESTVTFIERAGRLQANFPLGKLGNYPILKTNSATFMATSQTETETLLWYVVSTKPTVKRLKHSRFRGYRLPGF